MNIIVSKTFPKGKPKQGEATNFKELILEGRKIHTIRENADFWEKRIAKNPELQICEWQGLPYKSKVVVFKTVNASVERIVKEDGLFFTVYYFQYKNNTQLTRVLQQIDIQYLAKNDGLSVDDFVDLFKHIPDGKEMIIIHFGEHKYIV